MHEAVWFQDIRCNGICQQHHELLQYGEEASSMMKKSSNHSVIQSDIETDSKDLSKSEVVLSFYTPPI